jgi:MerR family transcriptional regulator/heat shock protein HspR
MPSLPFEDDNLPLFTVGQVSSMLEIQQAFLRRLDEHDVVRPSRSSGRQRRYTRHEITVIQYVVRLADEGMTLPSIRRVLELEDRIRDLESECDALREALRKVRQQLGLEPGSPREPGSPPAANPGTNRA